MFNSLSIVAWELSLAVLTITDVAKANERYLQFVCTAHTGFSYDDLVRCATRPMDLPPYERIMWARANTGQRTPYCDLLLTFDSRLYYRFVPKYKKSNTKVQCRKLLLVRILIYDWCLLYDDHAYTGFNLNSELILRCCFER